MIHRATSFYIDFLVHTIFLQQECPLVRYRAAKGLDGTTTTTLHDLVPSKLAAAVWNIITTYKSLIPEFPQKETCELLIIDRSVDQVCYKRSDNAA